ncbi:MAG: 50S ribosomal protein L11 methyltransferase [Synergistaceae bacterium]|jgi:ribosomal protein L11 methyltransferase|nr:50S ribosomal protein L11 methyltransferase [Synergistaceae bacterium]
MGNYWWYVTVLLRNGESGPEENEEILYSAAEISGSMGTEVQELPNGVRMRIYYRSDEDIALWRGRLLDALAPWPDVRVEDMGKIENQQWAARSEDAFPPLRVGRRVAVMAPWHKGKEPEGVTPIYINPGSAFGTGYHESTRIALELFERYLDGGGEAGDVIDVGAGSGILAIAALKLGAASARARDTDPAVMEEIGRNLTQNGIDPSLATLETGNLLSGVSGSFGVIFANILLDPLLEMLPSARGVLAPGGIVIFSGMTESERETFMSALADTGLVISDELTKGEWWGVAARNPAR